MQNQFFQNLVDQLTQNRTPAPKSIPCGNYVEGTDFDQWVLVFTDSVKAANNLRNGDARLDNLCLTWLPTKLSVGPVRSVYEQLPLATKNSWTLLKPALSLAFKDESEEIYFLSHENAWRRTAGMSLRDYKNGLVSRLDKYQPALRRVADEWERAAVKRFRTGLENPILESHILMNCQGIKHTLQEAYNAACNWENTLQNLASSSSAKNVTASLAGMLSIPQLSVLSQENPQFSALSSVQNEKRFEVLETSAKKSELDMVEIKASLTEVKEGMKAMKEDLVQPRYFRPFQRPTRPTYTTYPNYPARVPFSNQYGRSYVSQQSRFPGPRPQSVTPGLTGGPGYVTNQAPLVQSGQGPQENKPTASNLNAHLV